MNFKLYRENTNYSPISVIDCEQFEQMMIAKEIEHTDFSRKIYKNFIDSSYQLKYYDGIDYNPVTSQYRDDIDSYILLKSYYKNTKGLEDSCLSSRADEFLFEQGKRDYRERQIGKQYGVVPTIPYKYVSKMTKIYDKIFYALGYYPSEKIYFNRQYCEFSSVDGTLRHKDYGVISESDFTITEEKFSFPTIIDDKLILETYSVYRAPIKKVREFRGIAIYGGKVGEIKAIKYNNEWFRIEPVKWKKIRDNLVCTDILFESPVHMKNDYVKNDDIQSLDDTFLKWYIDNLFTKDLFKYTDCTFMKEQMIIGVDDDINSKMQEIERLKQIKANLILQQYNEEHIINTVHRNMTNLFEEKDIDNKTRRR